MTIRAIRLFGDPVLRSRADEVRAFDRSLNQLVDDMTETMLEAPGQGLAAPQIGVPLRVFTYNVEEIGVGHVINPEITLSADKEIDIEGCLSIPGLVFDVERPVSAKLRGLDVFGKSIEIEASELLARVFQHEIDHLDGVLYLQRLTKELRKEAMSEIRQAEWFGLPDTFTAGITSSEPKPKDGADPAKKMNHAELA
jgi:peptide deformylase